MCFKTSSLFLLFLLLASTSFSQTFEKSKLDQYFKLMQTTDRFMGNGLIYQNGKKIYSNSIGFSNIQSETKIDDRTMFRIGSITKTITATLVMKAVEEGKIKLSDNIKNFFPSIQLADQITIGHLLNHHSGIHNFTGGNFITWSGQPKTRRDLVDSIAKGGSDFTPGTKASYSNSNYVLLSFILEDVYRKPYTEILNSKITAPLRLKNFQFGDKSVDPQRKSLPYTFEAGWKPAAQTDLSIPLGAGAIVSTAEDLAKVLDAIFQGKIISMQSLAKMQEQADGYGSGIFERTVLEKKAYLHDGAIDGFNSYYYYFPDDKTLYVLLTNAENYRLDKVNESILSIVFNKPFDLPKFDQYTVKTEDLQQYAGTYTSQNSPLIIEISVKNGYLIAQPHGQSIYTMEPTGKDQFLHSKTEVTLDFVPEKNQMSMKQRQQTIVFTKR